SCDLLKCCLYAVLIMACLCFSYVVRIFIFFFFQAEDGIRDWSVTGVQTCALPIFSRESVTWSIGKAMLYSALEHFQVGRKSVSRSEERRVGKECRSRWWPSP